MNNLLKEEDKKFYSIDIAHINRNEFEFKNESINRFISVKKFQSTKVEPNNFYKPISKYLNFEDE